MRIREKERMRPIFEEMFSLEIHYDELESRGETENGLHGYRH